MKFAVRELANPWGNSHLRKGRPALPLSNGVPLDTADVYFEHQLPKPLISTILCICSCQLPEDSGDPNPPPLPLMTPTSQRHQFWQCRRLFLLSVIQIPNLTSCIIFSLFHFQLPVVVEQLSTPLNDAWKPNAAVLTRQTFISIISDPNCTFCMIFSLF